MHPKTIVTLGLTVGGLLVLAILVATASTTVHTTEHCVKTRFGDVKEERMNTGFQLMLLADKTCFDMTDQNFPPNTDRPTQMEAQTADPVTVTGDLTVVYSFDPSSVFEVFLEKRSEAAVEAELFAAIREGYRTALAGWEVSEIFSERRADLSDSVRGHIQRKISDRAIIKNVFVRNIRIPQQIEAARIAAAEQAQILDRAQKQFVIDSVNARALIIQAQASAEETRLKAQAYRTNPQLLELEVAQAMAKMCAGVTTCVIGGSVTDAFFGSGGR